MWTTITLGLISLSLHGVGDRTKAQIVRADKGCLSYVEHVVSRHWRIHKRTYQVYYSRNGMTYHSSDDTQLFVSTGGHRGIVRGMGGRHGPWTRALCHEVIEASVGREICDPVEHNRVRYRGMPVTDFVLPSWFRHRSRGPWDHLDILDGPGQVSVGGYIFGHHV